MAELKDVQGFAQQVAEAIATVLGIDVEISDTALIRVAGTGIYRDGVGASMDRQGFVYREVLLSGRELVIENPGQHELCQPCWRRDFCPEKYEIVCPINAGGRTVGAIGLLCFTDENAQMVREKARPYRTFLSKMAETIALKLKEQEYTSHLLAANRYLYSVLNCLEEGLITADYQGNLLHFNFAAQSLFRGIANLPQANLDQIFGPRMAADIIRAAEKGEELYEREVNVGNNRRRLQLLVRSRPVVGDSDMPSIVITFSQFSELSRIVNRLSTHEASYTVDDILGVSEAMQHIRERARVVAPSSSTVFIWGESGTGKEMLARAIHNLSPRSQHPFVAINCGAIPEALLESELFGYEEGAFTGARKGGKLGKFELADNGTLFLDEIGDMPLFLQAKLLRVLQERQIERIGGLQPIPVDVRIIAATHRDLEKMIENGEFRKDLYYRINVIPITIAPLRERKDDLDILCQHFMKVYNQQLGKNVRRMSAAFRERIGEYSWPGNVRELQNVIEYAMNMAEGEVLDVEHLPAKLRQTEQVKTGAYNLEALERETILKCVQEFGNTVEGKKQAAEALGIGIATLYRKLGRYAREEEAIS